MSQRPPALLTLLGLAATAGCQGGDTLRAIFAKARPVRADEMRVGTRPVLPRRNERCLASTLQAGLVELQRRVTGQGWGARRPLTVRQLRDALGAPVIDELSSKTGLSEPELMARLARGLPVTVALLEAEDDVPPPLRSAAHLVETRC